MGAGVLVQRHTGAARDRPAPVRTDIGDIDIGEVCIDRANVGIGCNGDEGVCSGRKGVADRNRAVVPVGAKAFRLTRSLKAFLSTHPARQAQIAALTRALPHCLPVPRNSAPWRLPPYP